MMKAKNWIKPLVSFSALTFALSASAGMWGSKKESAPSAANPISPSNLAKASDAASSNGFLNADATQVAFGSYFRQELYDRVQFRGEQIGGTTPGGFLPQMNVTEMQGAFFSGITRYISEHPALGGNYNRGFTPKIRNAFIQVAMEKVIPITPDGYLLPPSDKKLQVIALKSGEMSATGRSEKARLYLVNENMELISNNMQPITRTGYETLDGDFITTGSTSAEFGTYANIANALTGKGLLLSYNSKYASGSYDTSRDENYYRFTDCLRSMFDQADTAKTQACFNSVSGDLKEGAIALGKNLIATGARGALTGGVIGSQVAGVGAGPGAAAGAFSNALMVMYNTFLKKESFTANQMRHIQFLVDQYSFVPTAYGEIQPKVGDWYITNGFIRRAKAMAVEQNGSFRSTLVALDAIGAEVRTRLTIRVNNSDQVIALGEGLRMSPLQTAVTVGDNPTSEQMREAATITPRPLTPLDGRSGPDATRNPPKN